MAHPMTETALAGLRQYLRACTLAELSRCYMRKMDEDDIAAADEVVREMDRRGRPLFA